MVKEKDQRTRVILIIAGLLLGKTDRDEGKCGEDREVLHCERIGYSLNDCVG